MLQTSTLSMLINSEKKGLVGKGDEGASHSSYDTPYVRKDPTLFPPPPRTKVYEPGTGPAPPPPKAPKPALPERDGQFRADAGQDRASASQAKARPAVPPRLPPRQADDSLQQVDEAVNGGASPKEPIGFLSQDAVNRLGHAGITVHGFGIGPAQPPPLPSRGAAPPVPERKFGGQHMQELRSRFSTLNPAHPEAPKSEPSSVSAADARAAATAARDFHDRHGEQVASGARAANELSRKYGLAERAKAMVPADGASACLRASPPPPPPRPVSWNGSGGSGPPHVPYATKPRG